MIRISVWYWASDSGMRWITLWMVRSALYATTKIRTLGAIACPILTRMPAEP